MLGKHEVAEVGVAVWMYLNKVFVCVLIVH